MKWHPEVIAAIKDIIAVSIVLAALFLIMVATYIPEPIPTY